MKPAPRAGAPSITLVVAMDLDQVIGRAGSLPWHLPVDLRRFRRLTMGKPVIMGRRTYESIGRALPGRRNLIVTRQSHYRADGCEVASSLADAIARVRDVPEAMIIGGASLYAEALPIATRMHLTRVHARFAGDVRFPPWDASQWREIAHEEHPADEKNPHACSFIELVR